MLKLAFDRESFWFDVLPGVRILVRTGAADMLRAGGDDAAVKAGIALTRSLAHSGIAAWEGIGDKEVLLQASW